MDSCMQQVTHQHEQRLLPQRREAEEGDLMHFSFQQPLMGFKVTILIQMLSSFSLKCRVFLVRINRLRISMLQHSINLKF